MKDEKLYSLSLNNISILFCLHYACVLMGNMGPILHSFVNVMYRLTLASFKRLDEY